MKKMIFGLAALASLATLATTVESSNTFGVLKLMSPDKETAICVPWVKVGTGGAINPDSLVLTSNLKAGDKLYAFGKNAGDNVTYKWTLSEPGTSWGTSATTIGGTTAGAASASTYTINRGLGLLLVREGTGWDENTLAQTPIYLYGQYAELASNEKTTTCPVSTTKALSTLIAPPSTAAVDLNKLSFAGAVKNDMIMTQLGTTYYYTYPVTDQGKGDELKWCRMSQLNDNDTIYWVVTDVTIPAGRGAWYIARKRTAGEVAQTSGVTITWAN